MKKGFSVVEVVLAAGIFAVFISGAVVALISGWYGNRQGADTALATEYAGEGLEAVRSMRNRDYALVTNTAGSGISRDVSGLWSFSGVNNTTDSGRMTRAISVESVNRLGDNIVPAPTGTTDPNTKKITAKVNWNLTAARPQEVAVSSYLTNWKAPIGASGGLLVYGDATTTPRWRGYDQTGNIFGGESNGPVGTKGLNWVVKSSPVSHEAIAGYTDGAGRLQVLCFDGTNWSAEWGPVGVGGTGTTRRFDIAYEKTSGDVLVVYSRDVATTNEMGYRTKLGSTGCGTANWSGETPLNPVRTSGIVYWVQMERSPASGSNNIALSWADASSYLSAMIWTGSSWGIAEPAAALETNLERVGATPDVPSFDMAYESVTGNLMVVWGLYQSAGCKAGTTITTTNCIRYARYTTSWSAVAVVPTVAAPATNIDISANPDTNELLVASLDNDQADLSIAYWSGNSWTGKFNQDQSTRVAAAGSKLVATGWLINGSATRKIVIYNDSGTTNVGWVVCTTGVTCTTQTDWTPTPVFANPQTWYDIQTDPNNKNQLMLVLADSGSDLFAKRLDMTSAAAFTWTNSDDPDGGGPLTGPLENSLGQAIASPFSFGYWMK